MQETHRKNHYIPKFMLKYWLVEQDGFRGVHVYRVADGTSSFDRVGRNARNPFSFAIVEDLYVPIIEGQRAIAMEKGWFNGLEHAMAEVIRQAHDGEPIALTKHDVMSRLKMGLLALHMRPRAIIELVSDVVDADPRLRAAISANPERSTHRIVLENLIHMVTELTNLHPFVDYIFLLGEPGTFIIGDRPCFSTGELGRFAVLTDRVAVQFSPSRTHCDRYKYVDAPDGMVDLINERMALQARDWLVAGSSDTLVRYSSVIKTDEWHEEWEATKPEFVRPGTLSCGWSITE